MSRDYFIEWRIVLADLETAEDGERYSDPGWGAGTRVTFPGNAYAVLDLLDRQHEQLEADVAAITANELRRDRRQRPWWRRLFRAP